MSLHIKAILHLTLLAVGLVLCSSDKLVDEIIEWVQSMPGGYFNSDKIEIRDQDSSSEVTSLGVFAKADLSAGELLFQVPTKSYIHVWDTEKENDDSYEVYYHNLCLLAKKTKQEMLLGDDSEYAPYIRYLQRQARGQIPATWSTDAKKVLREMMPKETDGVDWIDHNFKDTGCISATDPFEEHLVALVKQRGLDNVLIPIWDMVNHDNGRINTKASSVYSKEGVKMWADEGIKAGEELFQSYDECPDCGLLDEDWGTPEILRDFGFVEGYPHRYVYDEEGIWFEVYAEESDKKVVRWDDDDLFKDDESPFENVGPPDHKGLDFLRQELTRVQASAKLLEELDIPSNELSMILQYKSAASEDLSLAIKDAEARLVGIHLQEA